MIQRNRMSQRMARGKSGRSAPAAGSRTGLGVLAIAAALAADIAIAAPASAQQPAERIWSGGTVLTMNDKVMRAEAVAEAGGKIVAVGAKAEVMRLKGPITEVIDLKGRTMLPGFLTHPISPP